MKEESRIHDFDTLLEAIKSVKAEGFSVEFVCKPHGFLDPESENIYVPESICKMEFIRIQSPLSEPDEESILYLLETLDGKKGWISDSFGYESNTQLTEHINKIKENTSCPR